MASLAPYMEWAKSRPHAGVDLALSNVLACTVDDLEDAAAALDLSGTNDNGYPPLVEAIAGLYGVSTDRVATAIGTSGANFLAGLALIAPGDHVLVESPAYDPLLAIPRALGAHVGRFTRRFEDNFAIDPDAVSRAMTPSTRLIIVTQPHNPSGGMSAETALVEIARTAERQGAYVLVDEVYLDATSGCGATPAALFADNIITTNSLTKSYGLAPLRCGWVLASDEVAERIRRTRDVVDGTGSIVAERLSAVAFQQLDRLAARASAIVEPNVARFRSFLEATPALQGFVERATVAFPRLASGEDAAPFAEALLRAHDTAVVPGRFFEAAAHFRIGLGVHPDVLARGLENIRAALASP